MATEAPQVPFEVPTINIAPYLANPSSQESVEIVDQVRNACMSSGFFQLVGHGIGRSLQDSVFKGSASFFALPFEEKKKLDKSSSMGASNRGYEVLGGQSLEQGTLPDLKEVGYYSWDTSSYFNNNAGLLCRPGYSS